MTVKNDGSIKKVKEGFLVTFGKKEKLFTRKPIFLPSEYDLAVRSQLSGEDVYIVGMNGYSSITPEKCVEWGVQEGTYEVACENLLYDMIRSLQKEFPGISVRIVHGASDMGVDRAIINVANAEGLNLQQLGFSCPEYMMYVQDDDVPVYVAKNKEEYAECFVRSLDMLIAANGRAHAFEHDISSVFKYHKYLLPVNILRMISSTGGPAAINAQGQIEDAVSLFEEKVQMMAPHFGYTASAWDDVRKELKKTAIGIVRKSLSPRRAYAVER